MIAVAEMNSLDELANLRLTWRNLWNQTAGPSFFQSYDALRSYWRFYAGQQRLRTLVVTLGTRPIGILPLVTRPVGTSLGSARVLSWPAEIGTPFFGQIGPNPAATLAAAFRYVCQTRRDWSAIELQGIHEAGTDRGRTLNGLTNAGFRPRRIDVRPYPVVQPGGCWDSYIQQRSLQCRQQIVQCEQVLQGMGRVSFHRWRSEGGQTGMTDRRWDLFQAFEELRLRNSDVPDQTRKTMAYLRDLHPAAVDWGVADLCTLSIDGFPIAVAYNYATGTRVENVYLGAHEDFGSGAVHVLLSHMLRDSAMRGDDLLLFRPMDARTLTPWITGETHATSYGCYSKLSVRAQMLKMGRSTVAPAPPSSVAFSTSTVRSKERATAPATPSAQDHLKIFAG